MEQIIYERPRERLRVRGVHSLTLTELLQVIIGSGMRGVSGARLAKRASRNFTQGVPTYEDLLAIPGLGEAKVCQLLAACELGRRMSGRSLETHLPSEESMDEMGQLTRQTVQYVTYGGDGQRLQSRHLVVRRQEHHTLIVRRLFAAALADGASSVVIGIGWRRQDLQPGLFELSFAKAAKEVAELMQVRLGSIILVSATGSYRLGGTDL